MNDKKNKRLRIFVDTNVLISAILSETSISAKLLRYVIEEHQLLICSYTITESSKVIERKFPKRLSLWDKFLLWNFHLLIHLQTFPRFKLRQSAT